MPMRTRIFSHYSIKEENRTPFLAIERNSKMLHAQKVFTF